MGRQKQQWDKKVGWMLAHRELWIDLDPDEPLYVTQRERWLVIVKALKSAGLVSHKSGLIDVDVRGLISAAAKADETQNKT